MKFEWDENKNIKNIKKHQVSFDEAKTVFYDSNALYEYDAEHSTKEERFKIIGASYKERLLIVCHCVKENDIIRIFSAREADAEEKEMYYKTIGGKK